MMLPPLPQHDREPARGDAEECTGNHISKKVEVGTDEAEGNGSHADAIEHRMPRIAYPEHRYHRADGGGMSGGKGREPRPAVEWVEAVDAVANEGRVFAHPGLRPSATENEIELILHACGHRQTGGREYRNRLQFR